ncbi:MAG: DUF3037 domain-containing protein [Muribaculaceae bacterium]|nr:DUF3037 domain-containing protein [Muribaculaceae bacterium]
MQSKSATNSSDKDVLHLYEYAVVRYIPSIERGERLNIGLIMMCKRLRWIRARFDINLERLSALYPSADIVPLNNQLTGFELVSNGDVRNGGVIAQLEPHERFRWLTAVRSACIQTSRPHAGLTHDLDKTFDNLFASLVL